MAPLALAYHLVDWRFDIGITWITPAQFARQMEWLAAAGYRTCSLSQCLAPNREFRPRQVVITFDDGYRSLMTHVLPVMQQLGFTATVYPVAAYVGRDNRWDVNLLWRRMRHLDWEDLRTLAAAGWEIGNHSLRHAYLPALSAKDLADDLQRSRGLLEDKLQVPVVHLSLPFGRGNARVLHCAAATGHASVAFLGQAPLQGDWHDPKSDRQLLVFPRRGIYLHDTLRSFQRRVQAAPDSLRERARQRAISFFALGTVALQTLAARSAHGKKDLEF